MRPTPSLSHGHGGFALPVAIFLLVVLGGLAVFIARISATQHAASALDIQRGRAEQVARSGLEWGLYQVLRGSPACGSGSLANLATLAPGATSMAGFRVTVQCQRWSYTRSDASTLSVHRLVATACTAASGDCPSATRGPYYVEWQADAVVER